jgi:hypothetical protein
MGLLDGKLNLIQQTIIPAEIGRHGPGPLAAQGSVRGEGNLRAECTYEDICYLLQGLLGDVSAVGGSAPYSWTYSAPAEEAAVTPHKYSLEGGAAGASYVLHGALFKTLRLTGEAGGLWEMSSDLVGETIGTVSLASLADRTVNLVRMADTSLYVDTWGGTMGSTAVTATLISFELNLETGRHTKLFAGSVSPASYGDDEFSATLRTVLEFNASAKAYFDALIAPALIQKFLQIKATTGTDTALKSLAIQMPATLINNVTLFDDREGNMIVSLEWQATMHATFATWLKFVVQNALNALV